MNETGARITVQGMVQGVGYRYFALRRGNSLGLSGYVRNMRSGAVEVEVEGERGLVEEFISQLRIGPQAASVSDVSVEWKKYKGCLKGFEVRF